MEKIVAFKIEDVEGVLDTIESTLVESRQRIAETARAIEHFNKRIASTAKTLEETKAHLRKKS